MTREVMRYKLNELRMMLNDGEHGEEQEILVDIIKELDKAENKGEITALEAENKTLRIKLENAEDVLRGLKEDLADARAELRERW